MSGGGNITSEPQGGHLVHWLGGPRVCASDASPDGPGRQIRGEGVKGV